MNEKSLTEKANLIMKIVFEMLEKPDLTGLEGLDNFIEQYFNRPEIQLLLFQGKFETLSDEQKEKANKELLNLKKVLKLQLQKLYSKIL